MINSTLAQQTRQKIQLAALDTELGLPRLPHIPEDWEDGLSEQQREENLLHVALWIVEQDQGNFDMAFWHKEWSNEDYLTFAKWSLMPSGFEGYNNCGTVHCIAGFAQGMAGLPAFDHSPCTAGTILLGREAGSHFDDDNDGALAYLKQVIARNS